MELPPEPNLDGMSLDDKCNFLYEENKKLRIDISSLQLSNRSMVNQNRDTKKKVMDYRLQISDLEGNLKKLESVNQDLLDSQRQCENMRLALEKVESNVSSVEYRASQAEEMLQKKEVLLENTSESLKASEQRLQSVSQERDQLSVNANKLQADLSEALNRVKDFDKLSRQLSEKTELLEKLLSSGSDSSHLDESVESLAAVNAFFKSQQAALESELTESQTKLQEADLLFTATKLQLEQLTAKYDEQSEEMREVKKKVENYEGKIKDLTAQQKKMKDARMIGPSMPPWITEKKLSAKSEAVVTPVSTAESLSNADEATLKARVIELEEQIGELNKLLNYREDVILRIHEEISKKASQLEAAEVERSTLKAQIEVLKMSGKKVASSESVEPATKEKEKSSKKADSAQIVELEAECERLRGKRDREYQRRKRVEAELDEFEQEINKLREKIKTMEETSKKPAKSDDAGKLAALQSTLSQLRMDNEAKRSEMFDLRTRFEDKCNAYDKVSGEAKVKETKCCELERKLKSAEEQLLQANKDLELVRCQMVRGGPEVQRLQTELSSLKTSNELLTLRLEQQTPVNQNSLPAVVSIIHNPPQIQDDLQTLCQKLDVLEAEYRAKSGQCESLTSERETLLAKTVEYEAQMKGLEEELKELQASGGKKRKREEEVAEVKRSRKSRFNEDDEKEQQQYCSNCAKIRGKLVETESQLKAALEREASLRMQLKDFKNAGGSAVETKAQLTQHRRNLKLTCEAAERLLAALGPSMYDDPAVLSMREILGTISY